MDNEFLNNYNSEKANDSFWANYEKQIENIIKKSNLNICYMFACNILDKSYFDENNNIVPNFNPKEFNITQEDLKLLNAYKVTIETAEKDTDENREKERQQELYIQRKMNDIDRKLKELEQERLTDDIDNKNFNEFTSSLINQIDERINQFDETN